MKLVETQNAVGQVLCHDITQIIPGKYKGPVFRKGHIIQPEDIPVLLSVGKEHLYVWENDDTMLHENEAAEILRDICRNEHMRAGEAREGKIELTADADGLFLVDLPRLRALNAMGELMIATRSSGFVVKQGDKLCGTRVIQLVIKKEKMAQARALAGDAPILRLLPLKRKKFGIVATGSEVKKGLIEDKFTPILQAKLAAFGCECLCTATPGDDTDAITAEVHRMLDAGCEMVFCTGGMSVDPDDRTPLAIKNTGARIVSYGAPVLPGAMFLVSYMPDGRPVCGLPGCVMYAKRTILDLVLPYLLAEEPVTAGQLAGYGNGGLCLNCPECHFPNCGFGKGVWGC